MNDGYSRVKKVALKFVESMKLGDTPGIYQKEKGGGESLYGSYHAAHILDMYGELEKLPTSDIDTWAEYFLAKQTDQGYFSNKPEHKTVNLDTDGLDLVWHSTRGIIWALRILGRKTEKPFDFIAPLLEKGALYKWVKKYDWSNSWAAGNQILACATVLFAMRDWFGANNIDELMEREMYPALEELIDSKTGYWGTQLGANLPNGLFGTIHVTPVYFAQKWPLKYVDRNIDSTIECQLKDGSYWPGGSDCPDFDGAYMLANLYELSDYRKEDVKVAAEKYLAHALQHEAADGCGWLLHRKDSKPSDWRPRPHFVWKAGDSRPTEELRDDDPNRTHIMLGSWFYPLSIALITKILDNTGYEGEYKLNKMSLHECNVFDKI
jgi:hypothetical protein